MQMFLKIKLIFVTEFIRFKIFKFAGTYLTTFKSENFGCQRKRSKRNAVDEAIQ